MFLYGLVCVGILGIDLSTQYIKIAESTFSGEPKVIKDGYNRVNIPAAAASKYPIDMNNLPQKLVDFPIKFGAEALPILRRSPQNGYEFLPKTIGRSNTSFHTSANITTPEFVSLYFMNYILDHGNNNGLTFAVPSFWTGLQREALKNALKLYRMPLEAIIDDTEALAANYGATRYTRYQKATWNVLFVDFGATSFKVHGITFQWKGDHTLANETANEWSEKVGGYYCAKVVAAKENISISEAMEEIQINSNRYVNLFKNQTIIIEQLLKRAVGKLEHSTKFNKFHQNSFKVDEVQLIGAASSMPYLRDIIKKHTNCTNIKRDFNINEEISVGAVYCIQNYRGYSKTPMTFFQKQTPFSYSLKCGGYRTVCTKGNQCQDTIKFEHRGCTVMRLVAKEDEIPEGSSRVLASYELLNISNMNFSSGDRAAGLATMRINETRLEGVTWCKNTECYPIAAKYTPIVNPEMKERGVKFLTAFSIAENERRAKEKALLEVNNLLDVFDLEQFEEFPLDIKYDLAPYKYGRDLGTLNNMSTEELKEGARIIRESLMKILPQIQLPEPPKEDGNINTQPQNDEL
ncbi:hypothetical protein TVAG_233410 [Trichomonas vaginalis G3]|uniref:DnaK protein n=1 Tax=Trichomonas vaginalis (strain ATCC PRA-98 / G3) TaxID=412133 RepID=A2FPH5_TRIV3|nr:ATP binding [Trichomonas vaginalis G3]EAX93176.1 hypothetical protein TVAG_233410 [Trichomonas vaginalis G3]KAI5522057.1 ATP binding [Trichomonas vaginalis G3]|eukprot:XP_001306106.1 hypothetical protein [Trichomonas vaginalis G3]